MDNWAMKLKTFRSYPELLCVIGVHWVWGIKEVLQNPLVVRGQKKRSSPEVRKAKLGLGAAPSQMLMKIKTTTFLKNKLSQ